MNKYQEAIKRVELDFEDRIEEDNILMVGRIDIEALQELVDKVTPIKPIVQPFIVFDKFLCHYCKSEVKENEHHCRCGQAIDWSEDE